MLRDSGYWRAKAEDARSRASDFNSDVARQIMEQVAHSYERMAARAEKREQLAADKVQVLTSG